MQHDDIDPADAERFCPQSLEVLTCVRGWMQREEGERGVGAPEETVKCSPFSAPNRAKPLNLRSGLPGAADSCSRGCSASVSASACDGRRDTRIQRELRIPSE